jgi:hypothetical protein
LWPHQSRTAFSNRPRPCSFLPRWWNITLPNYH